MSTFGQRVKKAWKNIDMIQSKNTKIKLEKDKKL
jgi:hypothetical protein